jgi:hypothetical protein
MIPRCAVSLTASPKRASPEISDVVPKRTQALGVGRHCVVRQIATHHLSQPSALLWNRFVHSSPQFFFDGSYPESHLRLHRNPQEVRSVRTEIPVHDRTVPVSCNPHERNSSAASARSPNYTGVRTGTATAKEGRGALCRTKESQSHRPPSTPAPQVEVRTRAVLPGGHCPEHQAAGPVPQPTNDVTGSRHFIGEGRSRLTQLQSSISEIPKQHRLFQHPQANALSKEIYPCGLWRVVGNPSVTRPNDQLQVREGFIRDPPTIRSGVW